MISQGGKAEKREMDIDKEATARHTVMDCTVYKQTFLKNAA